MSNHKSKQAKQMEEDESEIKEWTDKIVSQVTKGAQLKKGEQMTDNYDTVPLDDYTKACQEVYDCRAKLMGLERTKLIELKANDPTLHQLIHELIHRPDVVEMANQVSLFPDGFDEKKR